MKYKITAFVIALFAMAIPMRYAYMNFDGLHDLLPMFSFLALEALIIVAFFISMKSEHEQSH
jgi:hypothetical protein